MRVGRPRREEDVSTEDAGKGRGLGQMLTRLYAITFSRREDSSRAPLA